MTDPKQKPRFDPETMRFQAKVMSIAQTDMNASCEGDQAELFLARAYADYTSAGKPADAVPWIRQYLAGKFPSVNLPPHWVEDEPAWPFFNGEPMVFISQCTLPRNPITESQLTWETEVYVFGARIPLTKGYKIEYRIVEQFPGIDGTGDR